MKIEEMKDEFVITDFNELEAYKIACKIEKDGIDFYEMISRSEKNEASRKELRFLIKEEEEHLKFFEGCLFDIREKIEDKFEEDDLLGYMDYEIFQPYQSIKGLADKIEDAKKTLHLGVLIEEKSIKFYKACRDKVLSLSAKRELSNIIEEEKRHKRRFEDMLSRL